MPHLMQPLFRAILLVIALGFPTALQSQLADNRTDWMYRGQIGLSTHYIARNVESLETLAKNLKVDRIANQSANVGAAWFLFTLHHEPWLMMAPNATYDRIVGDQKHTSKRDLPMELYKELNAKNIRLMLYVNLRMDPNSASAASEEVRSSMGGWPPNDKLIENMAAIYKEFSLRYGSKVSGWWVDGAGAVRQSPQRDRWLKQIADALRAGNSNAIVAFNAGVRMERYSRSDYTAGEMNDLTYIPNGRWFEGAQWHALTYLGGWWSWGGTRFSNAELINYSAKVISNGGALTFDVGTLGLEGKKRGDVPIKTPYAGYIDPSQAAQLSVVIKEAKAKQKELVH